MKIRLVPRGAKAGLGWVVCYVFHTLLCLLSFHLEIGAFVLRVDCRCLLWAQFAASFFLREHCFCFVLSTKKSCAPRCCGCMRQRKGSPYTWALCGSATKWDAYIRTRKPVGTKPSSCSTSDSAPVQTTSQQSGQWRRSSAGNGAALMAHLAALGDPLRPGLSMNSLAWPSCSDGTKSGVGLPKKQSGWERQTNWKSSVVFFFSKINE